MEGSSRALEMEVPKMKIRHAQLFVFGVSYYFVLPPLLGAAHTFHGTPAMESWYQVFNGLSGVDWSRYALFVALIVFFFLTGTMTGATTPRLSKAEGADFSGIRRTTVHVLLWAGLGLILGKNSFHAFSGYSEGIPEVAGQLSALNTVATVLALYGWRKLHWRGHIPFLGFLLTNSVLLLGMGGRLYVLLTVSAFLLSWWNESERASLAKAIGYSVLLLSALILVGVWRIGGGGSMALGTVGFFAAAEGLYTWISAGSYFSVYKFGCDVSPANFVSSFVNFIPTLLLPDKGAYIKSLHEAGVHYLHPFGADSIAVSLLANFGLFVAAVATFFLGVFYALMRNWARASHFGYAVYYVLLAMLPFQMFRDSFSILNKQFFFNGIVLPALVLAFATCVDVFLRVGAGRQRAARGVHA